MFRGLCETWGTRLQIAPDISEIVETLLAHKPLRGADGAFGETTAGLGVVAEVDAVVSGFEHDFMQADYVALSEGSDLEGFLLGAGLPDHSLDRDGGAARSIFFVGVVAFENLAGVVVAQGGGNSAGYVEEEIHTY